MLSGMNPYRAIDFFPLCYITRAVTVPVARARYISVETVCHKKYRRVCNMTVPPVRGGFLPLYSPGNRQGLRSIAELSACPEAPAIMPAAGSLVSYTYGASRVLLSPVWPGFSDPRQVYGVARFHDNPAWSFSLHQRHSGCGNRLFIKKRYQSCLNVRA